MNPDRWQKIEQLFHAARDKGEGERTIFLAEACAGDEELRRQVERLLEAGEKPAGLLESPIQKAAAQMFQEEPTQSLVGRQLGSYHVLAKIGEGGMGEVYRAKDTKLRREVALKVLPKPFARDPERLARFEREAQILASLNHRNIAAIYGLENSDGVHFLVLELVEGETLAERIVRAGPLPAPETLGISKQVAEALEYAHKKAVTHRDIKPANIKVTPEGEVKVLDFGLAKIFEGDRAGVNLSELPTLGPGPTRDGQILGTPAYMSPEQVRGQEVDKRTDIWAFGCVLYELLTGKQAFRRETLTDTVAAVLDKEPDWATLPANTPATIRAVLRRCLQKDADRRLHDIADARIEIEEALTTPATMEAMAATLPARPTRNVWRWALVSGLACVMVGLAILAAWNLKPPPTPPPPPVSRLTITLPAGQRLAALDQPAIAISPDGKNLVYVAVQDNQSPDRKGGVASPGEPPLPRGRGSDSGSIQQLYLRPLDSLESKPIPGTEGAVGPFFSPDGQWIGFFAGGQLKKISASGGAAVTLATATQPGGASWSSQGTVALQPISAPQGLQQISQEGGTPQPLTRLGKGEIIHRWPEFLPGGKAVLFAGSATFNTWNNAQIAVQPAGTGERKNLAQGGTQPRYATTGHLLYAQSGTLMAAPFDPRRLELTGGAVPALEGVMQSTVTGAAQYSVSSTGTLVYLAGGVSGNQSRLVWVSRNGEEQPLPAAPHNYNFPRVSPEGRRVAVGIGEQATQVWVYDISRDTLTRLTFEGNNNTVPAWSPDGKRIAFQSSRAGPLNVFWQAADGSGGAERLTTSDNVHAPNSFSPDGRLLAFIETTPATGRDIWVLRLADPATAGQARKAQPFLRTPYEETAAKFSPDGKWLAYSSDESRRQEIYVQPYPGPGGKWQISTDGGQDPVWNPNGRELFYRSGSRIMAVDVDTKSGFAAGKPRMLFEGPYLPTAGSLPYYDVSPDGQRFLMLKPVAQQGAAANQFLVVLNWFEELKRRVPTK